MSFEIKKTTLEKIESLTQKENRKIDELINEALLYYYYSISRIHERANEMGETTIDIDGQKIKIKDYARKLIQHYEK